MEKSAHIAQVPLDCDLDVATAPRLRRVIDGLIDDGCRRIVINMAGCDYVDSAGMALVFLLVPLPLTQISSHSPPRSFPIYCSVTLPFFIIAYQ